MSSHGRALEPPQRIERGECPPGQFCHPFTQHTEDSIRDVCAACFRKSEWQTVSMKNARTRVASGVPGHD
jgi:hypothetical protein